MAAPSGGWCTGVVREVRHPTPRAVQLRIEVDRAAPTTCPASTTWSG